MTWELEFLEEANKDFSELDQSIKLQILKKILSVSQNPTADGYGKPLNGTLSGCYKIKFQKIGKRVVYKIQEVDGVMLVIIISARADSEVYKEAEKRIKKYNLN